MLPTSQQKPEVYVHMKITCKWIIKGDVCLWLACFCLRKDFHLSSISDTEKQGSHYFSVCFITVFRFPEYSTTKDQHLMEESW